MDAHQHGFLIGFREDGSFQVDEDVYRNVDLPTGFLDNEYENPDLERYLDRFNETNPSVAVVGDAYNRSEAVELAETINELAETHTQKTLIGAPKCREAIKILGESEAVLGYANGSSTIQGEDLGTVEFRGYDIHILGGTPGKTYDAIQMLTQPTLDNREPANIVGLDWNGFFRSAFAEPGEYWSNGDGRDWEKDYGSSTRETVARSLENIKRFWQGKGLWPETEPRDIYGAAVKEPDEMIFFDDGGRPIGSKEELEKAVIAEYRNSGTAVRQAYRSKAAKDFIEYREGLI